MTSEADFGISSKTYPMASASLMAGIITVIFAPKIVSIRPLIQFAAEVQYRYQNTMRIILLAQ